MRALGRALRVDLHRSVCSRPFFVTRAATPTRVMVAPHHFIAPEDRLVTRLMTLSGIREMMLANRIMEMPLPMPNSVICSPSHMTRAEPAVKARTMTT